MSKPAFRSAVLRCLPLLGLPLLAGCGSLMMRQDTHPTIKANPTTATLVIYRVTSFGGAMEVDNYLDDKFIGRTSGETYFLTEVPPGTHYVVAHAENYAVAKVNFAPGKVYYLEQGIYPGVWQARTGYEGSTPSKFKEDVEEMDYEECCSAGEEKPTIDREDYKEATADHEKELKEDPEKHKDTTNLTGY